MKAEKSKQKRISFADTTTKVNKEAKSSNNSKFHTKIHSPASPGANKQSQSRRKSKFNIFTAVVTIQALYRGYALRRDWIREDAAIFLQSVYRGHRSRVRVSKIIEAMLNS
jgi:hypothetical protein